MSKKTFLLYREQDGGCDYTIGCGVALNTIRASSMEEAIEIIAGTNEDWKKKALESKNYENYLDDMIHQTYLRNADEDSDCACVTMTLYEVVDSKDILPVLKAKLTEINSFQESLDQQAQQEQDLKEFERLKKKLGK